MDPAKQPSFLPWGFSPEKLESQNVPYDWIVLIHLVLHFHFQKHFKHGLWSRIYILLVKRFAHDTLSVD